MAVSQARASRIASSCPKDFDFQYFIYQNEGEYPSWLTKERIFNWINSLPESVVWNGIICLTTLVCIILVSADLTVKDDILTLDLIDLTYVDILNNILYALHTFAQIHYDCYRVKQNELVFRCTLLSGYVIDLLSFVHYVTWFIHNDDITYYVKISCYYARLHSVLGFLWALLEHDLRGSVLLTLLKYIYIFVLMRILYANAFVWLGLVYPVQYRDVPSWLNMNNTRTSAFFRSFSVIDKHFLPIGPDTTAEDDRGRLCAILLMVSGALMVTGTTIASLSLIIGLYLRPEEVFRARFRIIMDDLKYTNVPYSLQEKVDTFYRMYWLKQKAVYVTRLLSVFPPTLTSAINVDIYFEAQQKSRILCDLSYHFLSEIAKKMETIHFVPGDTIITRNSSKDRIIYISYGDVEMLTAEDDESPMLRFTRGTIMNSSGGCVELACSKAHVAIRAATFCTAHVLHARDLWLVTAKYGKANGQSFILHSSFEEHFEKVKRHYSMRKHPHAKYQSTIMRLKRNLIELKEAKDEQGNLLLARNDAFLEIAGCYTMRNQEGTSLTEESDAICLRSTFPCILQPSSSLLIAWQSFVAVFTLAVVFIHPFQLVYVKTVTRNFQLFDYFGSFIYVVDIIVTLSIGTKIEEGVPITFTQTSSKQIRSFWFLVDVISAVPMFEFFGDGRFTGLNKIFKLFKVFSLMKHLETVFLYHSTSMRFIAYCMLLVCMVHLLAALQQGVYCFVFMRCIVDNFTHAPYWTTSELNDGPYHSRYTISWYWAISLMTFTSHKTAAISLTSFSMQVYITIVLEICTITHILIESTYSATIMVTSHMRDQYDTCIETVKDFLVKSNVDPILRYRFITYLKLCWYTDKAYAITHEKHSILFDLPAHVYQEILALQRSKYLLCLPLCKHIHKETLKKLSSNARLFYTSPNEILQNTGDITNEIHVIHQGICEVIDPTTRQMIRLLTVRNYFGDMECLMRIPAYYTVRAITHLHVYSIARKFLHDVIRSPKIRDTIIYTRKSALFASVAARRGQFLTYEMPSSPSNRTFFRRPRKHETDAAFLQPFSRLGFFSILRYVFPRFTIRPDGKYLTRYEWFRAACAVMSSVVFPTYTILSLQYTSIYYLAWLLDLSSYFDIFHRMLVAYYDENGILVYHPASTAAHYFKGAFLVDLLSCLPLEYFDSVRTELYYHNNAYRIPKTGQHFMFNRFLQLYRVPNALDILNDFIDRQDIILLIKALPIFLALLILITCCIMEESVYKWKVIGGGWRINSKIDKDHIGSWIDYYGYQVGYNITESPANLVLTTFYWVVYEVTTTGFNLFQPSSATMLAILIAAMIVGSMFLTFFSVKVISIRANVNQALATFQAHMRDIKKFMKSEYLDIELQKEVLSYYEYKWEKTGGTDYRSVLKLCDQITLRTDTILHIYGQTFSKCPILHKCEVSLLRTMGRAVYSMYYRKGMTVVERNEVIKDLYIIDYGTIEMRRHDDDSAIVTKLPKGSMFGNLGNVETSISGNKFVVGANVHLLKIDALIFYEVIADFPSVKVLMMKFRPNDENYIIGSLRDQSVVLSTWRERAMSSPLIVVTQRGILKYFHVHNKGVQIYLIIVSLFCIYGDMFNAGFQNNSFILIGIVYALDFCFLFKILMEYTLPYISEEESESRMALESTRSKYFKGEFKYDVLSILPFELFCLLNNNPWSIFAFLRLNRLIRVTTVYNCLGRYYQKLNINLTISTICTVFIWFTLFVHGAACIWYYISIIEESQRPHSSWRYDAKGKDVCWNHYICSMYFILSTFTQNGVGDILPRRQSEVAFASILMICSTMIYMIYVGEFSNIIQYQSFTCFKFYTKYLELLEFLKNNRVSPNLVKMTTKYTLYLWRTSRGRQMPYFLESAPQCFRLKVMGAAYLHHLSGHPVFSECEPAFLRHLVLFFRPFLYSEKMWVVKEGEITNSMYFVHRGCVLELDEEMEDEICTYYAGTFFGTKRGLTRDMPFALSYQAVIKSQVLTLCHEDWEYLLKHFPKSGKILMAQPEEDEDDEGTAEDKKKVQITKGATIHRFGSQFISMSSTKLESLTKLAGSKTMLGGSRTKLGAPALKSKLKKRGTPKGDTARALVSERLSDPPSLFDIHNYSAAKLGEEDASRPKQDSRRRKSVVRIVPQNISTTESTTSLRDDESSPWPLDSRKRTSDSEQMAEDDSPWPLDSRRRISSEEIITHKKAEIATTSSFDKGSQHRMPSQEETTLNIENEADRAPKPSYGRRKSTVHGIDKEAIAQELASIKTDDEYSPWPLDSRKTIESPEEFGLKEPDQVESEEEEAPKPSYGRRKSTVHGIDKDAVAKELESLKSSQELKASSSEGEHKEEIQPEPSQLVSTGSEEKLSGQTPSGENLTVQRSTDERPSDQRMSREERLNVQKAREDRLSDRTESRGSLSIQRSSDERMSDQRTSKESVSAERSNEERLSGQRASEDRSSGQRASEDRPPHDQRSSEERFTNQKLSEQRSSVERSSGDRLSVQRPSEEKRSDERLSIHSSLQGASEEKLSSPRTSEDRTSTRKSSEKEGSVSRASEERLIAKKSSDRTSEDKLSIQGSGEERPSVQRPSVQRSSKESLSVPIASDEKLSVRSSSTEATSKGRRSEGRSSTQSISSSELRRSSQTVNKDRASLPSISEERPSIPRTNSERGSVQRLSEETGQLPRTQAMSKERLSVKSASEERLSIQRPSDQRTSVARASVPSISEETPNIRKLSEKRSSSSGERLSVQPSEERLSTQPARAQTASQEKLSISSTREERSSQESIEKPNEEKTQSKERLSRQERLSEQGTSAEPPDEEKPSIRRSSERSRDENKSILERPDTQKLSEDRPSVQRLTDKPLQLQESQKQPAQEKQPMKEKGQSLTPQSHVTPSKMALLPTKIDRSRSKLVFGAEGQVEEVQSMSSEGSFKDDAQKQDQTLWPMDSRRRISAQQEFDPKAGQKKETSKLDKKSGLFGSKSFTILSRGSTKSATSLSMEPARQAKDDDQPLSTKGSEVYSLLPSPSERRSDTTLKSVKIGPMAKEDTQIKKDKGLKLDPSTQATAGTSSILKAAPVSEKPTPLPRKSLALRLKSFWSRESTVRLEHDDSVEDLELTSAQDSRSRVSIKFMEEEHPPQKTESGEDIRFDPKPKRSVIWFKEDIKDFDKDDPEDEQGGVHSILSHSDIRDTEHAESVANLLDPHEKGTASAISTDSGSSLWSKGSVRGIEDDYYEPGKSRKKGKKKKKGSTDSSEDDYESRIGKPRKSRKRRSSSDRNQGFWKRRRQSP